MQFAVVSRAGADDQTGMKGADNRQPVGSGQPVQGLANALDPIALITLGNHFGIRLAAKDNALRQTPSLPGTAPRSDRFRCSGRGSNFLAVVKVE